MKHRAWVDRHFGLMMFTLVAFVAAAVVLSFHVFPAQAATGPSAPYTDPQATGFVTLYDKDGNAIKSGLITDKPFVAKAVSNRAAPPPYDKAGRKATLLAYQPREGVAPIQWSGDTLTASAAYPDPAKPTATGTAQDFSLKDFLDEFPPKWDGLIQLRLYLSVPGSVPQTSGYTTTDIKITGQVWTVVGGGPGAGAGGAAIPGKINPSAVAATTPSAGPAASASKTASQEPSAAAAADGGGSGGGLDTAALAELPYLSTPGYLLVAAAAIVAAVFGGVLMRRRSRYLAGEW